MQTNILFDDELLDEALNLTGTKTKNELIHLAIMELIRSRKKKSLFDLAGKIKFYDNFDYKEARKLRDSTN